ncbi:hypothetical protein IRB23SM22_11000 [Alkalibacterium sp. s-m-22]|uniref:Uncharacterized protein n=1 Tax=Alkalibacterium indicireducens TaxID=398758 RepID=A0ABN1AQT0_9LACT
MENDPTLHQDQQNQADHFLKTKATESGNEFIKRDPVSDDRELSEEEKAQITRPEDFEKFNLDDLDQLNDSNE